MEGPSLGLITEELKPLLRKRVQKVFGQKKGDFAALKGKALLEVRSWGKHLLLYFP